MVQLARPCTLPDLLAARSRAHPCEVALVAAGALGGPDLRYGQWQERASSVGHGLLLRGVRPGDRVALYFSGLDWLDYAVAYLAVLSVGGTAVHVGDVLPPGEVARRLAQCAVVGTVHGDGEAAPSGGAWHLAVGELETGETAPLPGPVPDDVADVLYTSGTTGPAKAFTATHANRTYGRSPDAVASLACVGAQVAPMPLGTTSSATTVSMALTAAARTVLAPPGDPDAVGAAVEQSRASFLLLTPWVASRLVETSVGERFDLSSLTVMATASAPMPPALGRRLLAEVPSARLDCAYSQSEAVPALVVTIFDPAHPTVIGRPVPGTQVQVTDGEGRPLPAGDLGEIRLRCAAPRRHYLDPVQDAELHVDGWVRTPDIGWLDDDGVLHLFDRRRDVVATPGHLVSSLRVEAALHEHPLVEAVAVVGVLDGTREDVAAAVVLRDPDRLADLQEHAARVLAPHERPARWSIRAALPRGVTGKVLKRQLRVELAATRVLDEAPQR